MELARDQGSMTAVTNRATNATDEIEELEQASRVELGTTACCSIKKIPVTALEIQQLPTLERHRRLLTIANVSEGACAGRELDDGGRKIMGRQTRWLGSSSCIRLRWHQTAQITYSRDRIFVEVKGDFRAGTSRWEKSRGK